MRKSVIQTFSEKYLRYLTRFSMKLGYFYLFYVDNDDFLSDIILVFPTQQFTVGGKYIKKVNFSINIMKS